MQTLIADLEADGLLPEASRVHQISVLPEGTTEVESYNGDTIDAGLERLRAADRLVFHAGLTYDLPVLKKVERLMLDPGKVIDTLVLSRLGNPERPAGHSLEAWGDTLGHAKVKHDDWTKWSPEMEHRCNEDVMITAKVWERLSPMLQKMPRAVEIEHMTARVVHTMCQRGIHFNEAEAIKLLDALLVELETARTAADAVLPALFFGLKEKCLKSDANKAHWGHGAIQGGVPWTEVKNKKLQVGSRDDVALYLKRTYGWTGTQKTKTGKTQITDDILRELPYPEAKSFADYYKVEKLISQLNSEINKAGKGGGWLHHVTSEGKLHAGFIPLKAVTGRPACAAPNLQQVSTDVRARSLFEPRPGWRMVGVDADGQELRCLGHYLWPYDGGEYAREVVEGDIHTRIQKLVGFHTRKGTKPVQYGLIYGAGDPRLGFIAAQDCLAAKQPTPRNHRNRGREIRRAIMEGIVGFKDLDNMVKDRAKMHGKLKGLDGRTLWVRSPHSALNLLLQSCGIIHMKQVIATMDASLREEGLLENRDYGLILWVHDELQFEAPPAVAELVGKVVAQCVETAGLELGIRTPMSGTYKIGNNWKETH